jgi:hypothetical protein
MPLYLWERVLDTTLNRRLGGLQCQSGHSGEQKNLFPCQELNPSHQT